MINAYDLKEGITKVLAILHPQDTPKEYTVTYVTANGKHVQVKDENGNERMISPNDIVQILEK